MTYKLTSFDIPTISRSAIGFDRIFSDLSRAAEADRSNNYPPYNTVKTGDNAYVIELAVTGFSEEELAVTVKENTLTITGTHENASAESNVVEYLHRGLARRNFVKEWTLGDHVNVTGVFVRNGIMTIDLLQVVPEEQKPKNIAITFEK